MALHQVLAGYILAIESHEWLSTASLVIFLRLVKYPTNLSIISFQDANLSSPKLSVALLKDHCLEHSEQWRSQDIAVARAQRHTTFVRTSARSAEAYRGVWGHPPPRILQPPRSVLRPYTVAKCKSLKQNSRMMSVLDSIVIRCYI